MAHVGFWYLVDAWALKGLLHPYFAVYVCTKIVLGPFGHVGACGLVQAFSRPCTPQTQSRKRGNDPKLKSEQTSNSRLSTLSFKALASPPSNPPNNSIGQSTWCSASEPEILSHYRPTPSETEAFGMSQTATAPGAPLLPQRRCCASFQGRSGCSRSQEVGAWSFRSLLRSSFYVIPV